MKDRPLKPHERVFVKEFVKTSNLTKSAQKALNNPNKSSSAVAGSRMFKKPNIQRAIDAALDKVGATPEFAVQVLADVAEQTEEIGARRLAAKDILELHGWRKEVRPQTTLQINNAFFKDIVDSNSKDDREVIDV